MSSAADCQGKQPFLSWRRANREATRLRRLRLVEGPHPYRCRYCQAWHVGAQPRFLQRPAFRPERPLAMPEINEATDLTGEERFAWYEAEILPSLRALAERCRAQGMDFSASVQVAPDSIGTFLLHGECTTRAFAYVIGVSMCGGSEDALINEMIRIAGQIGHSSAHLARLGIPTSPLHAPSERRSVVQ